MKIVTKLLPITVFVLMSSSILAQNTCVLKGKIIDRTSKELILYKATEDIRGIGKIIPILEDGSFEFSLNYKFTEAYQLIFADERKRGMWKPVIFFPEEGTINFTLHSAKDFEKNNVTGVLNKKYQNFQKVLKTNFYSQFEKPQNEINILREKGEYYSDTARTIQEKISTTLNQEEKKTLYEKLGKMQKDHSDKSPKAKKLGLKMDSLMQQLFSFRSNYIKNNPSEVAYYILYEDVRGIKQFDLDVIALKKNYLKLSGLYPNSPYSKVIGQTIESHQNVKIGGRYIDVSAPDINGKDIKISEKIKDQIALLDLWASWCGPCIKTSRTMVPIYKAYKNKGFTIVGIAREFNNTDRFKKAIKREKFPWLNLIDLDDANDIWLKYNIPFSGGGTFLIDKKGKILAINPSAEEVKRLLEHYL